MPHAADTRDVDRFGQLRIDLVVNTPLDPLNYGRLKWRCRRGMRELDQVTEGYLNEHYSAASVEERAAFERLLELQDPQLLAFVLHYETAEDSVMEDVLAKMRQR